MSIAILTKMYIGSIGRGEPDTTPIYYFMIWTETALLGLVIL